jgi:hypothetical protein
MCVTYEIVVADLVILDHLFDLTGNLCLTLSALNLWRFRYPLPSKSQSDVHINPSSNSRTAHPLPSLSKTFTLNNHHENFQSCLFRVSLCRNSGRSRPRRHHSANRPTSSMRRKFLPSRRKSGTDCSNCASPISLGKLESLAVRQPISTVCAPTRTLAMVSEIAVMKYVTQRMLPLFNLPDNKFVLKPLQQVPILRARPRPPALP